MTGHAVCINVCLVNRARAQAAKPTIRDIAALAGVGVATVERVLNRRGNVKEDKAARVVAAAIALGYPRPLPETHRGVIRIEVILLRQETAFFSRLSRAFEHIGRSLNAAVKIHRTLVDERDPAAIASAIAATTPARAGLIVAAPADPAVRAALGRVAAAGTPILQIVTRAIGDEADYVGIDNYAAGRTAAHFMSRMQERPGRVVALCHSWIYEGHRDRIRGFSDYLERHGRPGHDFVAVLFGRDDGVASAEILADALARWPDIVGLYNAGGANGAIGAFLRSRGAGPGLFYVGHELTERSARALREGIMDVVLDQEPEEQARRAIDMMLHRLGLVAGAVDNPPIRFSTITAENI